MIFSLAGASFETLLGLSGMKVKPRKRENPHNTERFSEVSFHLFDMRNPCQLWVGY